MLDHHMELHYSQTKSRTIPRDLLLDHHMELHYSQTPSIVTPDERLA